MLVVCIRTFSGCLHFPVEASNDPAGCVSLVEGMGELLASRLELLPQSERVQHARVLVSKGSTAEESLPHLIPTHIPAAPTSQLHPHQLTHSS